MVVGAIDPVAFEIGPLTVHWYGIIIIAAMMIAVFLSEKEASRLHLPDDFVIDAALWIIPIGIIGARAYYVLFELESYLADPLSIFYIWEGGLAIYGGVIAGVLTIKWICQRYGVPFLLLLDIVAPHTLLAQAIGRWGNFVNQEAYGTEVTRDFLENLHLPNFIIEQMQVNGAYYHPTFLYESIWNIIGAIILMTLRYRRKLLLRGEVVAGYMIWYGFGRFFIEGLRTDSLYLGPIRISQLVSFLLVIVGFGIIIYQRKFNFPNPPYYSEGMLPELSFKKKKEAYEKN